MASGAGLLKYVNDKARKFLAGKENQKILENQLVGEGAALKILKTSAGWTIVSRFIADLKKDCKSLAILEKDVSFLLKEQVLEDLENLIDERISESDSLLSSGLSESQ